MSAFDEITTRWFRPFLVGRRNTEYFMKNIPTLVHRRNIDGEYYVFRLATR